MTRDHVFQMLLDAKQSVVNQVQRQRRKAETLAEVKAIRRRPNRRRVLLESHVANFRQPGRRRTLNGREYIIAPMTLIVPGVLNGSRGALLYPADEIRKSVKAWDGVNITVNHPVPKNGIPRSGNDPDIVTAQGIGFVSKPRMHNDRLRADGWFDVERVRQVAPGILQALENGEPVELSTGLLTRNRVGAGVAKGRPYDAVAIDYTPDHVAILPDQRGACSVTDGCGVHNHTTNCDCEGDTMNDEDDDDLSEDDDELPDDEDDDDDFDWDEESDVDDSDFDDEESDDDSPTMKGNAAMSRIGLIGPVGIPWVPTPGECDEPTPVANARRPKFDKRDTMPLPVHNFENPVENALKERGARRGR